MTTRDAEVQALLHRVQQWAATRPDVVGVALVGSWARGDATLESDVDLVVLTSDATPYIATAAWIEHSVGDVVPVVAAREWGPVTERRLRLPSGLEVAFGFTSPAWAATDPVDGGTAEVVRGGLRSLSDPEGILARLLTAVA